MSRLFLAFLFAALLLLPSSPARAELDVTPFVGATVPTTNLAVDEAGGSTYFRNKTHTIYGVSVGRTLTGRFGLELAGAAGTGEMEVLGTAEVLTVASSMLLADLRGRVRLLGDAESNLALLAGVGYTCYNVSLFQAANALDGETQIAGKVTGVVGLGFRSGSMERLRIAVDLVDRIHEQGIEAPNSGYDFIEETQHDVTFTVGLTFPIGG